MSEEPVYIIVRAMPLHVAHLRRALHEAGAQADIVVSSTNRFDADRVDTYITVHSLFSKVMEKAWRRRELTQDKG